MRTTHTGSRSLILPTSIITHEHANAPPASSVSRSRTRTLMTGAHSLPVELLLQIFSHTKDPNYIDTSTIIAISQVCWTWRTVALKEPTLWDSVDFRNSITQASEFLERSQPRPVDVVIDETSPEPSLSGVVDALRPHTHRLRSLKAHSTHRHHLAVLLRNLAVVNNSASKLSQITLLINEQMPTLPGIPTGLRRLELRIQGGGHNDPTPLEMFHDLIRILRQSPALDILLLDFKSDDILAPDRGADAAVELPRLSHLRLSNVHPRTSAAFLSYLSLPVRTRIEMIRVGAHFSGNRSYPMFPADISGLHCLHSIRRLEFFSANPAIFDSPEQLRIRGYRAPEDPEPAVSLVMSTRDHCRCMLGLAELVALKSVEQLVLSGPSITALWHLGAVPKLQALLSSTENLRTLSLLDVGKPLLASTLPILRKTCARLERLEVVNPTGAEPFTPIFLSRLRLRERKGMPPDEHEVAAALSWTEEGVRDLWSRGVKLSVSD